MDSTETDTPAVGVGDVEDGKSPETAAEGEGIVEGGEAGETGEGAEGGETGEAAGTEQVGGEHVEGEGEDAEGEHIVGERLEGEHVEGEHVEEEHVEGGHVEGEHVEGEHVEGEHVEGEHVEGEHVEGEHVEGEGVEGEHVQGAELEGEHVEGEGVEGEQVKVEEQKNPEEDLLPPLPEEVVEEEVYAPPDPAAPFNFSDSDEILRPFYELPPDRLAEVEQLWELYQDYTPAYSDLDNYITEKEAVYMLKSLLIMTYTAEQLQELIAYCCRPPHPQGHIFFDQFVKMVTLRQRDFPIEEEIRSALQVFDPEKLGTVDREQLRETLTKGGYKMPQKTVDNLIKEVDMSNDGTIGIEDVVGTMCIDLNPEDMQLLRDQVYPPEKVAEEEQED